jgi:hypothetical protein
VLSQWEVPLDRGVVVKQAHVSLLTRYERCGTRNLNGALVGILSRDAIVHCLEVRRSLGVENATSDAHNQTSRAA